MSESKFDRLKKETKRIEKDGKYYRLVFMNNEDNTLYIRQSSKRGLQDEYIKTHEEMSQLYTIVIMDNDEIETPDKYFLRRMSKDRKQKVRIGNIKNKKLVSYLKESDDPCEEAFALLKDLAINSPDEKIRKADSDTYNTAMEYRETRGA